MSTAPQCEKFVRNAWKKELCSNCFKAKEEHQEKPAVIPQIHVKLPDPPKDVSHFTFIKIYNLQYLFREYSKDQKANQNQRTKSHSRLQNFKSSGTAETTCIPMTKTSLIYPTG